MSEKISLTKQAEKVKISLKKRAMIDPPTARVGEALDVSGSMIDRYRDGSVAKIVFRTLALANTFDDNGEMDMWAFDTNVRALPSATPDNFETFVNDEIIRKGYVGGGTKYSPCLNAMLDFYFPTEVKQAAPKLGWLSKLVGKSKPADTTVPAVDPAFAIFLTDGENDTYDEAKADAIFKKSQSKPIYWLLIGVGHSKFNFLEKMADKYPNVGFLSFENLDMTDEELYDGIISQEFVDWIKQ